MLWIAQTDLDVCRSPAGSPGCPAEAQSSEEWLSTADGLQRCQQEPPAPPARGRSRIIQEQGWGIHTSFSRAEHSPLQLLTVVGGSSIPAESVGSGGVLLAGLNCESVMHGKPIQHSAMHEQKTDLKEDLVSILYFHSPRFVSFFLKKFPPSTYWVILVRLYLYMRMLPRITLSHGGATAYAKVMRSSYCWAEDQK